MPLDEKFHLEMIELGLRERAAVQAADFLTDGDIEELRRFLSAPEREVPSLAKGAMGDPERAGRMRLLVDYGSRTAPPPSPAATRRPRGPSPATTGSGSASARSGRRGRASAG